MFMTNIIAARLLPQEVFGQFAMIRSTISSVEGILSGALGSSMIKRVSETAHLEKEKINLIISALFFTNILIAVLLALAISFLSPLIVEHFFIGQTEMIQGLYIGSFLLIATTLSNLVQTILSGFEEYKKLAYAGIAASLFSFPFIVLLIYFFNLYGAISGIILYFLSDFVWKYFQLKKSLTISIKYDMIAMRNEGKKLLSFSTPLFLSVIVTSVSFWYARVMVVKSTDSFAGIAVFDAAYQWLTIIMIITGATTSVALPMLSKSFADDTSDTKRIFKINLIVNFFIALLFALLFILLSTKIMSIYGANYTDGDTILELLSINAIFFTLAAVYSKYMIAHGKSTLLAYSSLIGAICMFVVLKLNLLEGAQNLALSFIAYYLAITLFFVIAKMYTEKKSI
jgi:O-antigen/teichoic acid export membrane protein